MVSVQPLCSPTKYIALTQIHFQFASLRLILTSAMAPPRSQPTGVRRLICTYYLVGLVQPVPCDRPPPQHRHWVARRGPIRNPTNAADNNVRFFLFFRGFGIFPQFPYSYAFDVDPHTQVFMNRRVFAYTDTGIPDRVQVDRDELVPSHRRRDCCSIPKGIVRHSRWVQSLQEPLRNSVRFLWPASPSDFHMYGFFGILPWNHQILYNH